MRRDKRWVICGDLNDYRQRVVIGGDRGSAATGFEVVDEAVSSLDVLLADGFCENVVERRPELDRWTLYHTRGPQERHLCQLDYILLSPALARHNATAVPDIVRGGQPLRTIFPPGQEVRALSARRLGPAEGVGPLPGRRDAGHRLKAAGLAFDMPRDVILPVDAGRCACSTPARIRSSAHNAEAIEPKLAAREWQAKPALFDGTVVLLSELGYARPAARRPLPRGALLDLHVLAQRARRSTADARLCPCRAGRQRQCAGGDPHGGAHGQCRKSLFRGRLLRAGGFSRTAGSTSHRNMAREVREETGLDLDAARARRAAAMRCRPTGAR